MSRPRSSRSLRAGLAVVAASAAALGVPALASANPLPPIEPTHTFDTPVIDGDFGEWAPSDLVGPASPPPSFDDPKADVYLRYDCRAGRLNLRVEALDGVDLTDDPSLHGGTVNPVGSSKSISFTGASPAAEFAFSRNASGDVTGWEMSFPLPDGQRYEGIGVTAFDGLNSPAEFSGVLDISCPTLEVDKTANGAKDLLFDWDVEKTVSPGIPGPDGETIDVEYAVTATKLAPSEINRRISGTITATNTGDISVPEVVLSEKGADIGGHCRIVSAENDGVAVPVTTKTAHVPVGTLAPGASASADYVCSYAPKGTAATQGVNYGKVSWPGPGKGGRHAVDGAPFDFDSVERRFRDVVRLVDRFEDEKPTITPVGATTTLTTTRTLAVPATGCTTYTNTATLVDGVKKDWSPTAAVSSEVCNTPTGPQVTPTEIAEPAPVVPPKRPVKPRPVRPALRVAIRGPKRLRQGTRARYLVRVANRGKLRARRVVTRVTVPRGMRIVRVLRAPGNAVVRGRTVRMRFNRINAHRAKRVVVVVKVRNGARRGNRRIVVRARAANLKGQKTVRASKRVRIVRGL